jgi:hypothetical protein
MSSTQQDAYVATISTTNPPQGVAYFAHASLDSVFALAMLTNPGSDKEYFFSSTSVVAKCSAASPRKAKRGNTVVPPDVWKKALSSKLLSLNWYLQGPLSTRLKTLKVTMKVLRQHCRKTPSHNFSFEEMPLNLDARRLTPSSALPKFYRNRPTV